MVKFTHYLITRFNVPVDSWRKDKEGRTTLDEDWMHHRLELFRRYCGPSVEHQSEKKFHWIIYCDPNTILSQKHEIEKAIANMQHASIRYAESHEHMMSDLQKTLAAVITPFVITSRLDNDDGLGRDYIKIVQEHFREKDKLLINQEGGLVYDINDKVMTRMKSSQRNHYTSLIEERKEPALFLTVLGFPHDNPPPGIIIENTLVKDAWLKIIHERNVVSRLKGRPLFNTNNINWTGNKKEQFPISAINTIRYAFKRMLQKVSRS